MSIGRPLGTTGRLEVGSVPFRACLFFATNPDERLLSKDIADKFGCTPGAVRSTLRSAQEAGFLASDHGGPGRGLQTSWSAGPALLELIGKTT